MLHCTDSLIPRYDTIPHDTTLGSTVETGAATVDGAVGLGEPPPQPISMLAASTTIDAFFISASLSTVQVLHAGGLATSQRDSACLSARDVLGAAQAIVGGVAGAPRMAPG